MPLFQRSFSLMSKAIVVSMLWLLQSKLLILCAEIDTPDSAQARDHPFILQDAYCHMKDSSDSFQGPVLDERWNDFPTNYTDHVTFSNLTSSATVSVFTNKSVEMMIHGYVNDDETYDEFVTPLKANEWVNFTFLMKDENVYVYKNQKMLEITPTMKPEHIIMRTPENVYWKIQNYNWSSCVSVGVNKWTLDKTDKSCLMFYVSLCKTCFLSVSVSDISPIEFTPNENNSTTRMEVWQSRAVGIKPNESNEITFNRTKRDNDNDNINEGHWEVDIRFCSEKSASDENMDQVVEKKSTSNLKTAGLAVENSKTNVRGKSTSIFSFNTLALAGLGLAAVLMF